MKNKEKYLEEFVRDSILVEEGACKFIEKHEISNCKTCLECIGKLREWFEQENQEPIELTKFEYDLLDTNDQSHKRKVGSFQTYNHMRKRGYFKNVPFDESIEYVLANCEVKDEK